MKKMLSTVLYPVLSIIGVIVLIYMLGMASMAFGLWDPFHDPRVKEVDAIVAGTKKDTHKSDVMRMVAERYEGLKQQPLLAEQWLTKAATAGDVLSMYKLMDRIVSIDPIKAADLKARILASKDGNAIAGVANRIASNPSNNKALSSEMVKAMDLYQNSPDKNNLAVLVELSNISLNSMTPSKVKALDFYLASAKLGHEEAMLKLAEIYKLHGNQREKNQNEEEAYKAHKLPYKAGPTDWYIPNFDVAASYQQALYWYTQAAEKNDMWAQEALGTAYDKGEMGLAQDRKKAIYWYKKSAAHTSGRMTNYAKERLKELQP